MVICLVLQLGGKYVNPRELGEPSDRGKCTQPTKLRRQV